VTNETGRNSQLFSTATGHRELDLCLRHHLIRCFQAFKVLSTLFGPLEYKEQDMLGRLDQETMNLEDLFQLSRTLPALPNLSIVLTDLNADAELQEIWLSASYPLNAMLIVPVDALKREIRANFSRIIAPQYPDLINSVIDGVMNQLTDNGNWQPEFITVYQFVSAFRGKHLPSYIESMAHEAWITAGLSSRHGGRVQEVMERLNGVPVVPPLQSVRHIGLVLVCPDRLLQSAVERYLNCAKMQLRDDLVACYICLLEHDDTNSRRGAVRALGLLNSSASVQQLAFVAGNDPVQSVREEARKALIQMGRHSELEAEETFESTKI